MTTPTSPNRAGFSRLVPTSLWGRLLVVAVVLAIVAAGVVLLLDGRNATSAALGREGTRSFEGTPDELPGAAVPEGAVEVEGTVTRRADDWSAAVTFVVEDVQREAVMPTVDEAMTADGCTLRQRAYDDTTMQVIYDCDDGSVTTVTFRHIAEGTGTAIVKVSP
ncbi:MAG TPA: hypothetical protein VK906_08155 [Egicoccus sp.]|nr:hypothetical protein [Egicoccus sp.]HSK23132.1 hypothetical protein [Egicoccus sp.]